MRLQSCLVDCALAVLILAPLDSAPARASAESAPLTLSWADNFLTIHGAHLPDGQVRVQYLEAYCRPGSTDRGWRQTVIPHKTKLVSRSGDGRSLELRCTLADGVVVRHEITAGAEEITFRVTATNPTDKASEADWAQPCIRVGTFTGRGQNDYLPLCFIFL